MRKYCVLLLAGCGCSGALPMGFPKELAETSRAISTSITDQAIWESVLARLDGQIIEPGMEGYAGVIYFGGAKLPGVSGQVKLEGEGRGSGLQSPEAQAAIRRILQDQASENDRKFILDLIGKLEKPATQPSG